MPLVKPKYQYKNWKKITSILNVKFKPGDKVIEGLLVSDKVGEIFFLNLNNLGRLPKDPDTVPGRN